MFLGCVVFLLLLSSAVQAEKPWSNTASVHWSEVPLGEALSRFASVQKIGIFLDRRIDTSSPLNFETSHQPLKTILQQLAASFDGSCYFSGSTVYIGPKAAALSLPVLSAEIRREIQKLPARQNVVFRRNVSLEIPFLSEPKNILRQTAEKNKLRWANLEILPHDLWDEKKLLNVPLYELLTFLLAGFDLSFQIERDGQTLTLIPLSQRKLAPIQETPSPIPATRTVQPSIPLAQRRFTLKTEQQPLGVLLNLFAQRLGLTLEIDGKSLESKGVATDTRVSLDVKNVPVSELFQAALKPLDLEFRIDGNVISVW